jgi:MFS family permease
MEPTAVTRLEEVPGVHDLWKVWRRFDRFIGRREADVFATLGHFLPDASVARSRRLQHLLFGKVLSDMARDAAKYAAVVAVVVSTTSAFESSLVTVGMLLPAAMVGLYAGEVADSVAKRTAIAAAYGTSGMACFIIPTLFGTSVAPMIGLVFAVTALSQLASPAENSVLPLVASDRQLATATSMLGLASSIGTALGTAILAPFLLRLTNARIVFYAAGVLLLLATSRVLHIHSKRDVGSPSATWIPTRASCGSALTWLGAHRAVATMVGVSVLAGALNIIMAALAPIYVLDVLKSDPTNAVFVMGPSGVAMTLAILLAPWCIGLLGERLTAALGFGLAVVSLMALGLVQSDVGLLLDPINPVRAAGMVGLNLSQELRTATMLGVPLGLGVGLTDNSVKTYISRRVPLGYQGRVFAARNTFESAFAILPLLMLSGLASLIGVGAILILAPLALYLGVLLLLDVSRRCGVDMGDAKTLVTQTFWEEPGKERGAESAAN